MSLVKHTLIDETRGTKTNLSGKVHVFEKHFKFQYDSVCLDFYKDWLSVCLKFYLLEIVKR